MIYTTGTIAINGNTVTGTGTNFSEPLSLIRVGCTLIAIGNPVQIFTITEIKSGTELSVTPAANPAIPAGTKFSILLSDSISVDGLAQDVAETLRYYQGKETEIAAAVEWWKDFGGDGQMDQLLANIRTETAQSTANAQKTEADKKTTEGYKNAAATSATAAKSSQDAAKASETSASNSKTAAATSATNAAKSAADALNYRNQAQGIVGTDIGLGANRRDWPDCNDPTGYIGFCRAEAATAKNFPSIASGELYLVGWLSRGDGATINGCFVGTVTRSLYTYSYNNADKSVAWTRHARKDEVSRLYNYPVETQLYAGESTNYLFISNAVWGARTESGPLPLGLNYGGTGGGNAGQARTNLEVMYEKKSDLGSTDINTLTGEYSGFYYQGLNTNATTARGYPVSSAGALLVIRNNANGNAGCTQLYFPYNATTGIFYMRQHIIQSSSSGWEWTAWKKFQSLDFNDSPQFANLNLVKSSDGKVSPGGIFQSILNDTAGAQRTRTRFYTEFRGDGKAWATTHLQRNDINVYAGLSEDGDFALSKGYFIGRTAKLSSNVSMPLTLTSIHPAIKFDETDRPEGAPDYAFICDGGNWRIEKNHWNTPAGGNCISYNYARNEIEVPNLKVTAIVTHTGSDWNGQQSDNVNKFKPIAGQTNTPENNVIYGGFHVGFSGNYATQFAGRNSKFYARSFEAGVDKGWCQLATLNASSQRWTGYQQFKSTEFFADTYTRKVSLAVANSAVRNGELILWGTESRPTVFEYKIKDPDTNASLNWVFYAQQNTDDSCQFQVNGAVNCVTVNQSSDRDLKDNIQVISNATEAIRKMNGYTYTLKENGLPYAGVIAQEVMEALPEAVGSFTHYGEALQGPTTDGNELREETRYLNVDYAAVTGLLVQVARETDNRVTELEEENASLRANIAVMDERIAKLEALVLQLTGSEE